LLFCDVAVGLVPADLRVTKKTHAVASSTEGRAGGVNCWRRLRPAVCIEGRGELEECTQHRGLPGRNRSAVHVSRAARGCGCRCGELAPRELRAAPRSYLWPRPPPARRGGHSNHSKTPSPATHTHTTHTLARTSRLYAQSPYRPRRTPETHILPLSECSLFSSSSCDLPGGIFSLLS
jgi:hypothetical protein